MRSLIDRIDWAGLFLLWVLLAAIVYLLLLTEERDGR